MKGKMIDKLNGRSRAVLDALREGRHAPVSPTPPAPAPGASPCVICESTLTAERVRRFPRAHRTICRRRGEAFDGVLMWQYHCNRKE